MDIKLYNILGLSRTDTLYFKNFLEQITFFNNNLYTTIETTFYPPHYTNKIRIDISEYTSLPQINYLSFYYLGQNYYYFIDSIHYINDSVLELSITMDTIQTYMFSIHVYNAHIERTLINRFVYSDYYERLLINRDYERENYSNKEKLINRTVLSQNKYWLVVKLVKQHTDFKYWTKAPVNNVVMSTGYLFGLIPLFYCNIKDDNGLRGYNPSNIGLEYIKTSEQVENMFIIDDLFIQQAYNENDNYYDFSTSTSKFKGYYANLLEGSTGNFAILLKEIPLLTIEHPYTLINAIPVKDKTTAFSYVHVPYVIDDNYISVNYGENISKTLISPSLVEYNSIRFKGYYDIETGARAYQILIDGKDSQETTQLVTSCENFSLLTNAYNQYVSRNIGTATIGQATKLINTAVQVARGDVIGGVLSGVSNVLGSATTFTNLKNTPNQEKQANNVNLDINSNNLAINYEINYNVSELQEVAKIIEKHGYKVNMNYVNNNDTIFEKYNTRYYFNYIKTSDINLAIDGINDTETINNIKERFNKGFRYWNYKTYDTMNPNTIFKYDNVEITNL